MLSKGHPLRTLGQFIIDPRIFTILALLYYGVVLGLALRASVESTDGRADLVSGDAGHYLSIADDFSKGDFSMDYVQAWPHRQPLYPALLAGVTGRDGRDALHRRIEAEKKAPGGITTEDKSRLYQMAAINVALALLGFLVTYFGVLFVFSRRAVAAGVGVLYIINSFMIAQPTRHFLTEPLHILLMMTVILCFYDFLQRGKLGSIYLAVVAGGLDYLARPNGLFVTAALMGTLVLGDLWLIVTRRDSVDAGLILRRVGLYAACFAVFAAITAPSWYPRKRDFGSPIYHGYLSNYMWVDTYKQAHVGEDGPRYHLKDYVSTHTFGDFAKRWAVGIWRVGFDIPWRTEDRKPLLYLCAWAGVLLSLFRGPPSCRLILLFGLVQLLPLIWTNMSNPNLRVPYASTLPFELFFAAAFLAWLASEDCRAAFAALRAHFSKKESL